MTASWQPAALTELDAAVERFGYALDRSTDRGRVSPDVAARLSYLTQALAQR